MNAYAIPGLKRHVRIQRPPNTQIAISIIETVAKYYDKDLEKVCSKQRTRDLVKVCQVATWLIYYKMPNYVLIDVAKLFGFRYRIKKGFDHSAIIHNRKCVQGGIDVKDAIFDDVDALLKMI